MTVTPRHCAMIGRFSLAWLAALILLIGAPTQSPADPIDYSFGTVQNYSYQSKGGFCVACSYINGATYLKNAFPSDYGGVPLATGSAATPAAAALNYAYNGWTSGGKTYQGYYNRCGASGNALGDWWQTTIDWTESYAPGRTVYTGQTWASMFGEDKSSWTYAKNVTNQFPTYAFLHDAATKNDFIELGVYGYSSLNKGVVNITTGHAINLADITYTDGVYTLAYQDPNFPTQIFTATLTPVTIGSQTAFSFYDPHSFESNAFLAAAFVMAPVPEPATIVLLGVGLAAILCHARWHSHRRA
ncbi:MAG: PEP-CTERM sorting domain-containing protein [Thermoguttaceae bacterium]